MFELAACPLRGLPEGLNGLEIFAKVRNDRQRMRECVVIAAPGKRVRADDARKLVRGGRKGLGQLVQTPREIVDESDYARPQSVSPGSVPSEVTACFEQWMRIVA